MCGDALEDCAFRCIMECEFQPYLEYFTIKTLLKSQTPVYGKTLRRISFLRALFQFVCHNCCVRRVVTLLQPHQTICRLDSTFDGFRFYDNGQITLGWKRSQDTMLQH